jgi:hypothetical protein
MPEIKKIIDSEFESQIEIQIGRKLNRYELQFATDKLNENPQREVATTALLVADKLKQNQNYETSKSNSLRQSIWDRHTKQFIRTSKEM